MINQAKILNFNITYCDFILIILSHDVLNCDCGEEQGSQRKEWRLQKLDPSDPSVQLSDCDTHANFKGSSGQISQIVMGMYKS